MACSTSEFSADTSEEDGSLCPNLQVLHKWVSMWSISEVEEALHIYYQEDYLPSPLDVLLKKPSISIDLTQEQSVYVDKIKSYIKFNVEDFDKLLFNSESLKKNADETLKELKKEPEGNVRKKGTKFTKAFKKLVQDIEYTRIQKEVYHGNYTKFVGTFAELCCLEVDFFLSKDDQVVWENLRGIPRVISTPAIRLLKDGIDDVDDEDCYSSVVSVVEVKNDYKLTPLRRCLARVGIDSGPFSSSNASGVLRPRRNGDGKKLQYKSNKERNKIHFEVRLNCNILGRHAGELLLDLRKCCKDEEVALLTMPGMIVDGTKVFFTLLEISTTHYKKLINNEALDDEDKAVIYYSVPLDILLKEDRDILIENCIRLNNMK